MIKNLLLLILFTSTLNASIIKSIEYFDTKNEQLEIKDIKESKKFQKISIPFLKKTNNNAFIKITFNKKNNLKNEKILLFNYNYNDTFFEKNIHYTEFFNEKSILLTNDNLIKPLFIMIKNEDGIIDFDFSIKDRKSFENKKNIINKIFGISYGIIFSSFLFYFAFYIYNKERMYIYYSLCQISILIILLNGSFKGNDFYHFISEFFFLFFLLFFNLFTRTFLNTKELTPKIDKILKFTLFVFIIDFLVINVFESNAIIKYYDSYFFTSFFLLFYLIAAMKICLLGKKESLFYLLGWGAVLLSVFIIDYIDYFYSSEFFNPIYIIHFTTPLESLILAFALSYKMRLITKEKEKEKQLSIQQNKLASMGEMIANIAHQWRQPLTHLSYIIMNLEGRYEHNKLNKSYFKKKLNEANKQIEFMTDTINSFRDFFKNDKEKEKFYIIENINNTIELFNNSFKVNNIKIEFEYEKDIILFTYKREFIQVIFNILNNAKEAFLDKNIENPKIKIILLEDNENTILLIQDNAGGIDNKILNKIFEPYFSTKEKGLGLGLYMSRIIIEKSLNGKLSIENITKGIEVEIKF